MNKFLMRTKTKGIFFRKQKFQLQARVDSFNIQLHKFQAELSEQTQIKALHKTGENYRW